MTLFARLTTSLTISAAAGATALMLLTSGHLPFGVGGLLVAGLLLASTAGLARWAIRPLQQYIRPLGRRATDPWQDVPNRAGEAWELLMAHVQQGSGRPHWPDGGLPGNPVLSCLFRAATADSPGQSHEVFMSRFFADWISDGTLRAVALVQGPRHSVSFLPHCPPGQRPLHREDIPSALRKLPATATRPRVETTGNAVWAAFPVGPAPAHPGAHVGGGARSLIVAWPPEHRIDVQEMVGLATAARYIGTRGTPLHHSQPTTSNGIEPPDLQASLLSYLGNQMHDLVGEVEQFCTAMQDAARPDADAVPQALLARGRRLQERFGEIFHAVDDGWLPARATPCPIHVPSLIEQVALPYEDALETGQIGLRCDAHGAEDPVTTDPVALAAIMDVLISNAVRFTPDHGRIAVRVSRQGRDGQLVIAVRDSGPGISGESVDHLGEPFYQGREQAFRLETGKGLGLALAQRLAHRMGGTLDAAGSDGKGSTFVLRIPLATPAPAMRPATLEQTV
ncbi:MAG: ATP-binding protein [Nitrospirota bacterium]|nr:ATP-binding protein [Nitrospirota bacterium]